MVRFVTMYGFLVLISMRIDLTQLDYWWRSRYERMSLHDRINWKAQLFQSYPFTTIDPLKFMAHRKRFYA